VRYAIRIGLLDTDKSLGLFFDIRFFVVAPAR
jgi:hypothetical protein